MIKQDCLLIPATEVDRDVVAAFRAGEPLRVEITKQSKRSLQHHKLFFALLNLTLDYWQPATHMVTSAEIQALKRFSEWAEAETGNNGAIRKLSRLYLRELDKSRKGRMETPHKSIEALLEFVKKEVGHIEMIATPKGVQVITKSINFNAMSQEQFNHFYKAAFSVCWRFIMSNHFESEDELQKIIDQMASMG